MKSKKWLISLGLAVVLVMAFALPACNGTPKEFWYTPGDEKISFEITATEAYSDVGLMVVQDLKDLGLDVSFKVIDSTTYYEYLYDPAGGGMQAFISAEDPSPDPWSDWIWDILSDPLGAGLWWNPCWYNSTEFNTLVLENIVAQNFTAKQEALMGLQEVVAEDVPVIFLVREENIVPYRVDRWDNWYCELGGMVTWINEHAIREVTPTVANTDKQLNVACQALPGSLVMDQEYFMYTHVGCLYLMLVYEDLQHFPHLNTETPYDWKPKLATNYSISYEDDGTGGQNQVWTVDLQEGVKWHDFDTSGEYFDADDVVYSMKNVWEQTGLNKPLNWTGDMSMLVEKTGPLQVEMRYVEGYHQNEGFFPNCFLWYAIVPEHVFGPEGEGNYDGWNEDPLLWDGEYIGTGPYTVKEFEPGDYLLLERFDDYWGDLPGAEQVLFKLYETEGTLWPAFEAGEIDCVAAPTVPFAKKAAYEVDPDIGIEVVDDLSVYYLGFNIHPVAGYEPLQDLALREAIAAAIDKANIVALALGGYGSVADSFVYTESVMHHPSLPNNDYDLTEAANILTAAGYTKHAAE
jgi:ABC-type transport system substrate-binding protein